MLMLLTTKPIKSSEIINQLFPNLWIFIVHIISTIILIILLSKLVYNPFKKVMRARRNKINDLIKETFDKQTKAIIDKKEAFDLLTKAKLEAYNIIINAKIEVEKKRNIVLEKTKEEIIELNKQAQKEIKKEKEEYSDDIRKTIINIAFNAAEKLLNKKISKEKNKELIEEFIKEFN